MKIGVGRFIALGFIMAALDAGAIDRYVVPPGTPGVIPTSPFLGWGTASTNIQLGFNQCNTGDRLLVSNGTYNLRNNAFLNLGTAVKVQGFGSREVIVNGNYPQSTNICLFLGHRLLEVSGMTFSNGFGGGVKLALGVISNCVIRNCQTKDINAGGLNMPITSGPTACAGTATYCRIFYNTSTNASSSTGAGVALQSTNSLLVNCRIYANTAYKRGGGGSSGGGGVWMGAGTTMRDCQITNNVAWLNGAGVSVGSGARVENCVIAGNVLNPAAMSAAGGVYAYANSVLVNTVISNNSAYVAGGVSAGSGGTLLQNCTICYNTAGNDNGAMALANGRVVDSTIGPGNKCLTSRVGGIHVSGASSVISNCLIVGNIGRENAGGVYMTGGLLVDSRVISNTCTVQPGGGIRLNAGGRVRNCLVAFNVSTNTSGGGNPGGAGGGVFAYQGGVLESCTIATNRAYTWGGGLVVSEPGCQATNCVIYGNRVTVGADKTNVKFHRPTGITTETNALWYSFFDSAIPPNATQGNITTGNAKYLNAAAGNFRLDKFSPCIDKGINKAWMYSGFDLDKLPRIASGTVDMGCYEHFPTGTSIMIR